MRACILIQTKPGHAKAVSEAIWLQHRMTAKARQGIDACYPLYGMSDAVAYAEVRDGKALTALLEALHANPGVARTETLPELEVP